MDETGSKKYLDSNFRYSIADVMCGNNLCCCAKVVFDALAFLVAVSKFTNWTLLQLQDWQWTIPQRHFSFELNFEWINHMINIQERTMRLLSFCKLFLAISICDPRLPCSSKRLGRSKRISLTSWDMLACFDKIFCNSCTHNVSNVSGDATTIFQLIMMTGACNKSTLKPEPVTARAAPI